jgi:hypothetical protein
MDPNKLSAILPKRPSGRKRSLLQGVSSRARPRREGDPDWEIWKIEQLVLDLCAQLDRSERKLATHIRKIDQNLAELAVQREEIRILERGLGIERQG